jgi:hypothetical protein
MVGGAEIRVCDDDCRRVSESERQPRNAALATQPLVKKLFFVCLRVTNKHPLLYGKCIATCFETLIDNDKTLACSFLECRRPIPA